MVLVTRRALSHSIEHARRPAAKPPQTYPHRHSPPSRRGAAGRLPTGHLPTGLLSAEHAELAAGELCLLDERRL